MAGSRTGTGANTTYTFSWTGLNLDAIADAAARQVWLSDADHTVAEYNAMTIQKKVDILNLFIASTLTGLATTYKRNTDAQAALIAADIFSRKNYGL